LAIVVDDSIHTPITPQRNTRRHRMRSNLCAMRDRIRHVGDERACLRAHLASLNTEAAIDAMRTVTVRCGENCHRAARDGANSQLAAAAHQHIADAAQWMRTIRMTVRIAPWEPGRPRDRHFALQ